MENQPTLGKLQRPGEQALQKLFRRELLRLAARAVDLRDTATADHSVRVEGWAMLLANQLGLKEEEKDVLQEAALLHDLGKIAFPDRLFARRQASTGDWSSIKEHPVRSDEALEGILGIRTDTREIVRHHHEKLDGSGYPDAIGGKKVNTLVRIIAVADIYDALTFPRRYRSVAGRKVFYTRREAYEELKQEVSKGRLDGDIVTALGKALFLE